MIVRSTALAVGALLIGIGIPAVAEGLLEGIRVIGWIRYADVDREWANVKKILVKEGAKVIETDTEDPVKLAVLLKEDAKRTTFLIPEQEKVCILICDIEKLEKIGRKWEGMLREFLKQGGRIVGFDYAAGGSDILRGAKLTTASGYDGEDVTGETLKVARKDDPLLEGVPDEFPAPNGTVMYVRVDPDAQVLVEVLTGPHKGAPVAFSLKREGGDIILLGFDYFEYNEATARLLVNAVRPFLPCIELRLNEPKTGSIEAGEFLGLAECVCVKVTAEPGLLAIALTSGGNLDLHISSGEHPERMKAHFSLVSPDGNESIIISAPKLEPGWYYIAIENMEKQTQTYTIAAIMIPNIYEYEEPVTGTVESPKFPLPELLIRYLSTEKGLLSFAQYRVNVPEGAKRLMIRLEGLEGKNIDLHIRYGMPVEIRDGIVVADLSSISLAGEEVIVISGRFLKPGAYYIAVEGLEPPQGFRITATIDCDGGAGAGPARGGR